MKLPVILIMLAALYFLYRIAFPKQTDTKKSGDVPAEKPKNIPDVMGKSRFVLSDRSKLLQTTASQEETETASEKTITFAAETGAEKRPAAIPPEQLDRVFGEDADSEMMSIPLEYENENDVESGIDFEQEEEAEELNGMLGHEAEYAAGVDFGDLQTAVKAVNEQPDEVSEETAVTLEKLENTDMFEMLVSGDEGKANWIKAVVERNIQSVMPKEEKTENETSAAVDYGDFDVADYLS